MKFFVLTLAFLSTPAFANRCFQTADCLELVRDCEIVDRGDGVSYEYRYDSQFVYRINSEMTCVTDKGKEVLWAKGEVVETGSEHYWPTREEARADCRQQTSSIKKNYKACAK